MPDKTYNIPMKMREASVLVLQSLLDGIPVKIQDTVYVLAEDNRLCVIGEAYKACDRKQKAEEVYLPLNYGIKAFIDLCNDITHGERCTIVSDYVLNSKGVK